MQLVNLTKPLVLHTLLSPVPICAARSLTAVTAVDVMDVDKADDNHITQLVAVQEVLGHDPQPLVRPINLNLCQWTSLLNLVANDIPNVNYVKEVLQYFYDIAVKNLLQDSAATEKIACTLDVANNFTGNTTPKDVAFLA